MLSQEMKKDQWGDFWLEGQVLLWWQPWLPGRSHLKRREQREKPKITKHN